MKYTITLQSIVADAMSDQDRSMSSFMKYLQWAIRGYRDLNINYSMSIKTHMAYPTSKNTINLPDDYVSYNRIGLVRNGKIYTLSQNSEIVLPMDFVDGQEVVNQGMTDSTNPGYFRWTQVPQETFNIGFYREDVENHRIILQGSLTGEKVIVEYVSNGLSSTHPVYVPDYAREPLIAYLHWQRELGIDNYTAARERERIYNDAVDKMLDVKYAFTPDEFLDAVRSGYTANIKI